MGKTYKDVKDFNLKRQKQGSRLQTLDMDLRTRVKPVGKKERGGGKNWTKEIIDDYINEIEQEREDEQYLLEDEF